MVAQIKQQINDSLTNKTKINDFVINNARFHDPLINNAKINDSVINKATILSQKLKTLDVSRWNRFNIPFQLYFNVFLKLGSDLWAKVAG